MSDSNKPWPLGLSVMSENYNSLEDELFEVLSTMGVVFTDFINQFLQHKFEKDDVTIERRSFMRYLSRDMRFVFEGLMRTRTVKVAELNQLERTSGRLEISDEIINYMISLTVKEGIGVTTTKDDICQHLEDMKGDKFLHHSEAALDYAIEMLMIERRIGGVGDLEYLKNQTDFSEVPIGWTQGGFVGYSSRGKKSGGLHLSSRSWEVAKEIGEDLNRINESVMWNIHPSKEDRDNMDPSEFSMAIMNMVERSSIAGKMDLFDDITDNAVLKLALWRGNLSAADVVDTAIEVLRSVYFSKD